MKGREKKTRSREAEPMKQIGSEGGSCVSRRTGDIRRV